MRLNRQVNNLLNMSRIEAGTVRLQNDWCDVNELLHTVIEECGADADGRTVEFAADDDLPLFKLDRGLLEQVLHNVIHNALQHTSATGRPVPCHRLQGRCVCHHC
jgi:two-component system sensor histidine kinase KdpD